MAFAGAARANVGKHLPSAAAARPTIGKSRLLQALRRPAFGQTCLLQPLQNRRFGNCGSCRRCTNRRWAKRGSRSRCKDRRLAKHGSRSRYRTDDWPNVSPAVAARPNVAQKKHSVAAVEPTIGKSWLLQALRRPPVGQTWLPQTLQDRRFENTAPAAAAEPTIGKSWLLQRLQARRFGNGGFCSRCRERLGALVWTRKLISEPLFRKLPLLSRTPKLGSARVARVRSGVAPERSCPPSSSGMGRQKSEHTRFSARRRKRHARGVPSPAPQRSPGFDFGDRVYRFPAVSNGKSGEPRLLRVRLSAAVPRVSASEQKREDLIGGGSRNGS